MIHEDWMRRALREAERAREAGEVPVGAIVVHEGQEIGAGFNQPISTADPTAHAEVVALLEREQIRHYTFLEELAAALAEGEPVQERPRDPQHPSAAFGRRMAKSMLARGFLP